MGKFFKDLPANPGVTLTDLLVVSYESGVKTYKATIDEIRKATPTGGPQSNFRASIASTYNIVDAAPAGAPFEYGVVEYDSNSDWSAASGHFVVPYAGSYYCSIQAGVAFGGVPGVEADFYLECGMTTDDPGITETASAVYSENPAAGSSSILSASHMFRCPDPDTYYYHLKPMYYINSLPGPSYVTILQAINKFRTYITITQIG